MSDEKSNFKSGFVSIIGAPNVGKSTLTNSLVGEKIAIISSKPQTTRNRIQGILTDTDFQAVIIDTPGMHEPKNKLGEYMMKTAESTIGDADIVLFVVDPFGRQSAYAATKTTKSNKAESVFKNARAVFLIVNKIDAISKDKLLEVISKHSELAEFAEVIPVSALRRDNLDLLLAKIKEYLPHGPKYFPDDSITDQPERQICAEMIREKVLLLMQDEIPHGVAVEIMAMKNRSNSDIMDIEATVYCERESHKGMIIGKGGKMLKEIGSRSRADIERALGSHVYLQLWVKVKDDWRDNSFLLRSFGYK